MLGLAMEKNSDSCPVLEDFNVPDKQEKFRSVIISVYWAYWELDRWCDESSTESISCGQIGNETQQVIIFAQQSLCTWFRLGQMWVQTHLLYIVKLTSNMGEFTVSQQILFIGIKSSKFNKLNVEKQLPQPGVAIADYWFYIYQW